MARFGQGMIQALTQPSYMQGLYEAAKGVGEMPERKRFESMLTGLDLSTSEGQRELSNYHFSRGDRDAGLAARLNADKLASSEQETRSQSLTVVTQGRIRDLLAEGKVDEAVALEQHVVGQLNTETPQLAGQLQGFTTKTRTAMSDAAWTQGDRRRTQEERYATSLEDALVSTLASDPNAKAEDVLPKIQEAISTNGITTFTEAQMLERVRSGLNARRESLNAQQVWEDSGKLPDNYLNYISSNPSILENNSALKKAYDDYNAETTNPGVRRQAVKTIINAVNASQKEQRDFLNSQTVAKIAAQDWMGQLSRMPSNTEGIPYFIGEYGQDAPEAFRAIMNDSDLMDAFEERLAVKIRSNPSAEKTPAQMREWSTEILQAMGQDVGKEKESLRRTEIREQFDQERLDGIKAYMEANPELSEEEATQKYDELERTMILVNAMQATGRTGTL